MKRLIVILMLAMIAGGCRATWITTPQGANQLTTDAFSVIVQPYPCERAGCYGFNLFVTNKTSKDIEIVWDQTMFINNGKTDGRFLFYGVFYPDRNPATPNDIVFPGQTYQKRITPAAYMLFKRKNEPQRMNSRRRSKGKGVYLAIKIGEEIIKQRIMFDIEKM